MDRFLNTIKGIELLVITKEECLSLVWKYGLTEEERENITLEDLTFENLRTIATNYSVYRESIISGFKEIKELFIEDTKILLEKFDRKIEVIDALQQRIAITRRFSSSNFLGVTDYESVPYKVIIDQCEHLTHDLKDLKAETLDSKEYIWKDIFKDETTFKSFEKYIKECIVEPYADLSYLFQRLANEKLFLEILLIWTLLNGCGVMILSVLGILTKYLKKEALEAIPNPKHQSVFKNLIQLLVSNSDHRKFLPYIRIVY